MKIQSVTFIGVRGVRDATFDLAAREGGAHELVVVTGPSASGKTRVVEAIIAAVEAIAPHAPQAPPGAWIADDVEAAKIKLAFHLGDEERVYAASSGPIQEAEVTFTGERTRAHAGGGLIAVLERYTHDPRKGKLEYFPSNRRIATNPPFHGLGVMEQQTLRSGKDPRKYAFILRFLRDLPDDTHRAQRFASLLEALSPTVRYVHGRASEGVPRCLSSHGRAPVSPGELSDGEADAVIFAATATAIGLGRSLVFVDRPELFADAERIPHTVHALQGLGEDNQLFLATSSAAVIASCSGAPVIALGA